MTLFGTTLGTEQIVGLIGLLVLLVFWVVALRNEQGALFHLRRWEADRKARREAELMRENGGPVAPPSSDTPSSRKPAPTRPDDPKRGPWS
ncbi:MAG TPA: hypothetical protein VF633_03125 [Brevundimonas sp.]|jgi:hypothetical protein